MTLTIAQKTYINQSPTKSELQDSLTSIRKGLKALDAKNKQLAIKAFYKAYAFLPRNCQGIRVCADLTESFMQMQAFKEVTQIAEDIEGQYSCHYFEDTRTHFDMFRIFANAAEAHATLGNLSNARRFSKMALDHQLETSETVDIEMLHLFMKQADMQ